MAYLNPHWNAHFRTKGIDHSGRGVYEMKRLRLLRHWDMNPPRSMDVCVYFVFSYVGNGRATGLWQMLHRRNMQTFRRVHKYNLTQGLLEKSKLAQHAYEEGHKICWNKAKVLQIEPNTTYRKYEESAHMSLLDHRISQPSLDISPIWAPVITEEVKKLQLRQV
jgi:hypothetical protein